MKLYEPLNHTPLSGHGYAGAETFGITPYNAPYEPSFITLDEFPQQRFWTWGMFATLEGVGPEVVAELYEQGWEPKTHTTQSAFFILENQFAQTLIVAETGVTVRDWAQAEDIRHAQTYPVFLSYQTQEEEETTFPPTSLTMGMQALISDSTSWHLYMVEQLGDAGSNLLEQIRAGMMLFSPDDQPSAQERRLREQERITRWW